MRRLQAWLVALAVTGAALAQEPEEAVAPPPGDGAATAEGETAPAAVATIPVEGDEGERPARGDAVELDTIEVTSSKRIKAQRDIPGSVGAIRGADLEKISAQGLGDYIRLVPGVSYIDQGNEESVPIIRGIATQIGFGVTAVPAGIYMDDMPFADLFAPSSIPDLNPFDLERVEVLKGPQGTLFGSGALAGAIRYIVQKPAHGVWETKLSGTYSHTRMGAPSTTGAGALNVPLGDTAALRAVGVFRQDGGLYDEAAYDDNGNTLRYDEDADRGDQTSLRLLGSWSVTDALGLSGFYFDQRTHDGGFGFANNADTPYTDKFPFASPRDHDFGGGNVSLNYDFDWAHLLSSTNRMTKHNFTVNHQEFAISSGNSNANEYVAIFGDEIDGWTQELRLSSPAGGSGRWEWLVGASFLHYGNENWQYTYIGPDKRDFTSPDQISEQDKAESQVFATTAQVAEEKAFFGELTGRIGDWLELTVGGRQYETTLEADTVLCGAQTLLLFGTLCREDHFTDVADGFNPKASVRYLHSRNLQAYVLVAKGFQFGGIQINPPAPGFAESSEQAGFHFGPYKSSSLWNYEFGLRTEWLERRLRFDFALFYMDWKDLQLSLPVPLLGTNARFIVIGNVARAHSEGLEVSFEVLPFDGARFTSVAAWTSAVTDEPFELFGGVVEPGTRLPGSPRFQWANTATYERALPYLESFTGGISLTHTHGGVATNELQATALISDFSVLDARVSLSRPGHRFWPEIHAGVNNITDVRGDTYRLLGNDVVSGEPFDFHHFNPPRTVVVTASWRI